MDYKIKISIIQFIVNLVWTLGLAEEIEDEKMEIDNSLINTTEFIDKKITASTNLIEIVDDINLFNPLDDAKSENIFKEWSKSLIVQVLSHKTK